MADEKQSPLPTSGPLADMIAARLASVGKSSQVAVQTIPSGEAWNFKATGNFFYVVEASAPFKARMDESAFVDVNVGSSLRAVGGAFFENIEVLNPNAVPITVKLYGGFAEYREDRAFAIEPLTDFVGTTVVLSPNENLDVPDQTDPPFIRRKYFEIAHVLGAGPVYLYHASTNPPGSGSALFVRLLNAGQVFRLESAGPILVSAPGSNGADVQVSIAEVYWVQHPLLISPPD